MQFVFSPTVNRVFSYLYIYCASTIYEGKLDNGRISLLGNHILLLNTFIQFISIRQLLSIRIIRCNGMQMRAFDP